MAKVRFTAKQKLFIAAYFECGLNGTEAAAMAGYGGKRATLASIASENLSKPEIRAVIYRLLEDRAMGKHEVLYRLTEQARATLGDFIDPNTERVSTIRAAERGKLHLIKEFTHTATEKGEDTYTERVTIKLHDAQSALVQLGRAHGLFKDKVDVTSGGKRIESDDDIRQDIQRELSRIADAVEARGVPGEPDDGAA